MKFPKDIPSGLFENLAPNHPIQKLDELDELSSTIDTNLKKELHVPNDVLDSFKIKDSLNPEVWPDGKLDPQMKPQLLKIANGFLKDLNLPKGFKIKDIIFTGSLANYNWSKFSDIDLHIVMNLSQFDGDSEMIANYFKSQKDLWNQEHDITLHDFPIEIFVQDSNIELVATAVYSILKDKWIKKPKHETFDLDKEAIKTKADYFIRQLKDIRQDYTDKQYQSVIDKSIKVKNRIKQMRKAGLEGGGEFSLENLVFKVLRRTPFMDILSSFKAKAYDNLMSLAEIAEQPLDEVESWTKNGTIFIKGAPLEDGTQRLYATQVSNVMILDRKKTDLTDGQPAKMATFGKNPVYRITQVDGKLKTQGVSWTNTGNMLNRLGLDKPSVVLNNNKTPLHWDSIKITQVPQAVNTLAVGLKNLPDIKWIG